MHRLIGVALAAALLAGCSGGDDEPEAAPDTTTTTATPAPLTPLDPPADFELVEGDGFTIAAPDDIEVTTGTGTNGEPVLVLQRGELSVGVVRDPAPPSGPADQADVVADQERLVRRSTDVTVDELSWPGTDEAALVRWTTTDDVETWQLIVQVGPLQLAVVATAPGAAIDDAVEVLRTFAVRDAA